MAGQTAEIGTAYISILPSTDKIAPGVKKALGGVEKAGESTGRSLGSKISSGIGKTLKVGAATAGVAVGGILATSMAKGLGRLNSLEVAQAKLRGLGNDAAATSEIMDNALASVKGTSFGMGEAATTAAGAVAAGIKPGKELEGVLKSVANSAAATGSGMDEMGSIFNKVASVGKAQNDVLSQVAERGLPIYQALADQLGVTTDEVFKMASAGKIGFAEFEEAMTAAAGTVAEELGTTTQGTLENLGSAMGRFGEALQKPIFEAAPSLFGAFTSVFDEMTDAVGPVSEELGSVLTPVLEDLAGVIEERIAPMASEAVGKIGDIVLALTEKALDPATWEKFGEVFSTLRDTVEKLWPSIESLAGSFMTISQNISVAVWESLAAVLNALAPVIESVLVPLVEKVAEFAEENPGAVQAMVVAFLGFKAVGAVSGPVKAASAALRNIGGAFTFLSGAFKGGGGVAKGLVNVMGGIGSKNPIIAKMAGIVGKLTGAFGKLWTVLSPILKVLGTAIRFINPWVAGFTLVAGALTLFFTKTETGQKLWGGFVESIKKGVDWIKGKFDVFKQAIDDVMGLFRREDTDTSGLMGLLGGNQKWHDRIARFIEILSWVKDAVKGVWDLFTSGDADTSGIMAIFGPEKHDRIVSFIDGVRDAFIKAKDILVRAFDAIWNAAQITLGVIGTVILAPLIIAWNLFSDAIRAGWENIIKPAWDRMSEGAMWLWENGIKPALEWISHKWDWLRWNIAKVVHEVRLKIHEFQAGVQELWETYVSPILTWISDKWDWLKFQVQKFIFEIQRNIYLFQSAVSALWANYVSPILTWISDKWDELKNRLITAYNNIKTAVIDAFSNALTWFRDNVVTPVINFFVEKWDWLKTKLHEGWTWIDTNVISAFRSGLEGFKSFFDGIVDGIGKVWDSLRGKLAKPINFMINEVYNGGILAAWNTMRSILPGLKEGKTVNPIPGYARGGGVQHDPTGAVRGPGTGTSDSILARIANGEHIWTAREVVKAGGHDVLYAMRDLVKSGRPFSFDGRGGLVGLAKKLDLRAGDLTGAAPGLLLPGFAKGGEVRPFWETQLERAHKWASVRHGRPYVFGGSAHGAGGTDCSGFMSGIADVIQGGNGARKWATMAFSGGGNSQMASGPQGFVAGLGPGFSIGVTNGGPGGGHTAGTLSAAGNFPTVNVESGGSPSMVKYGIGADGADGSYFRTHYHLPIGADGAFVSGGAGGFDFLGAVKKWVGDKTKAIFDKVVNHVDMPTPPPEWHAAPKAAFTEGSKAFKDYIADKIENLGELTSGVWGRITDLFDNGGWLMPGRMATNQTGKPEPILTAGQWASFSALVKALPGVTDAMYTAARELEIAFEGDDAGYGALAEVLGNEEWAKAVIQSSMTLGKLSASVNEWRVEMEPVVRKSAEDYAMEQGSSLLSPMGLEGAIPLAQKVGAKVWDAYHAQPVEPVNSSPTVVEIDAQGGDFVHVDDLEAVNDRVDGLEVKVNKKPAAAAVTRGGVL